MLLEVARKLGVDRLSETAKKFGLGEKVLEGFIEERSELCLILSGRKFIGQNWYLGEIYTQVLAKVTFKVPLQLCLMTAQIANGGFK